jgi:dipeptidyl-peptidase-4
MASETLRRRVWLPIALIFAVAVAARAQQPLLTLDDIYDPDTRANFNGNPAPRPTWIDQGHYAWPRQAGGRGTIDWLRVDAATGNVQPLFDAAKMEAAIARLQGVAPDEARRLSHSRDLIFNEKYSAAIMTIAGDLYVYQTSDDRVIRLTEEPTEKEHPTFSPDGNFVAFVYGNNLHVVDIASRRESALTTDGAPKILNGKLDWVYEEEIYGRGQSRGYWWSPDSSRIAFLQIDDRPVSTFLTIDDIP